MRFTASAIYRQILVVQAATAVKAGALKATRQASAAVATKEAASAAGNEGVATGRVVVEAMTVAVALVAAEIAPVARIARAAAQVQTVAAEIAPAGQERDNNRVVRLEIREIIIITRSTA